MAEKSMHHYAMEDNGNGAAGGQFVVTVGADGKLMQVREPLFMPSSSGVPTLAGGKREELNSNIAVSYYCSLFFINFCHSVIFFLSLICLILMVTGNIN